ncbi:hypothetical protein B0H34DRAFT_800359 [Crassisporium funariophilum]|nr:hypothetical protein B0H34DRAFT_800359 [Crassisporium funariophilum]
MAGRWTQYEDDSYRLPEGFKRIGYDADTRIYTYSDRSGTIYQGAPGAQYGTLSPVPRPTSSVEQSRPSAFASNKSHPTNSKNIPVNLESPPSTFQDILPPSLITSSTQSEKSYVGKGPREQFADAARKSALPKMQGVVNNLRRSVTSMRKSRSHASATQVANKDEYQKLVRRDSESSSASLRRSATVASSRTDQSHESAVTVRPISHS